MLYYMGERTLPNRATLCKFGGIEVNILDVASVVGRGGGLGAFDPSQGGGIKMGKKEVEVFIPGYEHEPLNKLMTGVRYGGEYSSMLDYTSIGPSTPTTMEEYYAMLTSNLTHPNCHMRIDVTRTGSTFRLDVYLDNHTTPCYSESGLDLNIGNVMLQSHWGSGVVFSNVRITGK